MISLLISLLIFCLIAGLIWWVVGLLPLPPPFRTVLMVVLAVIFIIYLLETLGALGGGTLSLGRPL
jgi:hypothetical protein